MANLMRRMFTEEQIKKIAKKVGTKLYLHFVDGQYDDDSTDTYTLTGVYFITTSSASFMESPFEGYIIACGGRMNGDDKDYNIITYNSADGRLIIQISGTGTCQEDMSDTWDFTADNVIPL